MKKKKIKITKVYKYPLLNKVIKRLFSKLPEEYRNISFGITITRDGMLRGAFANTGEITLGMKMMDQFKNDEYILVSTIAHELGHHILGHLNDNSDTVPIQEHDCDHFGLFLAMQAGYDIVKYYQAEKRFYLWYSKKNKISKKVTKTHGSDQQRLDNLKRQLRYLGYEVK